MTTPDEGPRDWKEALEDRVWSRWRWILALVVLVFVLNNLVGFLLGGLGMIAFANRLVGRALKAQKLAQQVGRIASDSPDD